MIRLALLFALSAFAAPAQALDFNTFTCAQFSAEQPQVQSMLWYWMDGQIHGAVGDTTFDTTFTDTLLQGIRDACKQRPTEAALSVYEDIGK